jgi:hypothetical protein
LDEDMSEMPWTKGNDGATTAKAVGTEPFEELDA